MFLKEETGPEQQYSTPAIEGNLEVVVQAVAVVSTLSDQQYTHIAAPYLQSSIGQHMRHILDLYLALFKGIPAGQVDYDSRRRNHPLEQDRQVAIDEWQEVKNTLMGLSVDELSAKLDIKSEATLNHCHSVIVASTLARELLFVSSHAIHHFAMIRVAAGALDIDLPEVFGLAPATATYFREQA